MLIVETISLGLRFFIPILLIVLIIMGFYYLEDKSKRETTVLLTELSIFSIFISFIFENHFILASIILLSFLFIRESNSDDLDKIKKPSFPHQEDIESLKFYFKKSHKEGLQQKYTKQKWLYGILSLFVLFLSFLNILSFNSYSYIFFLILLLGIKFNLLWLSKADFYGGEWIITISDKELIWDVPKFEKSFQVNIIDIKRFVRKKSSGKGSSVEYFLETEDKKIIVENSVGIDIEEFKNTLVSLGVEYIEILDLFITSIENGKSNTGNSTYYLEVDGINMSTKKHTQK